MRALIYGGLFIVHQSSVGPIRTSMEACAMLTTFISADRCSRLIDSTRQARAPPCLHLIKSQPGGWKSWSLSVLSE